VYQSDHCLTHKNEDFELLLPIGIMNIVVWGDSLKFSYHTFCSLFNKTTYYQLQFLLSKKLLSLYLMFTLRT